MMLRKKFLLGTLVVIVLIVASAILGGLRGQQGQTATVSSTSTESTLMTTSGCPQLLQGPKTASNVTQVNGSVGSPFYLDAGSLFALGADGHSYAWSQVFPSRTQLDYATGFIATLANSTERVATASFPAPGNYRFQLAVSTAGVPQGTHSVDVLVTAAGLRKLVAKGVIFGDVFEDLGGKNFILGPHPEPCQSQLFDNAMAGPARVGAGWVGFVPAEFYSQVSPSPIIGPDNNDLSLNNDTYYSELMASAKAHGFKIDETVQYSVGPNTPANQSALLQKMENSSGWWDGWFTQWKSIIVGEASRAQKAGVDMLTLCLYCEDTFRPDVFPNYTQRWEDIISGVRQVFKGQVAMSLIVADNRFTMYKDLDAVFITIFPGLYTSSDSFADPANPTFPELNKTTARLFSYFSWLQGKIPVYIILLAYSSLGEFHADPPPWGNNPPPANLTDFRVQTMYYEAMFSFLKNQPWVSGFFSERWDYFDHFARPIAASNSGYFDQTLGGSPRSKPAEAAIKLWFALY